MAVKPVFTDKRRELLAKTIMDVEKIIIVAALASEFFLKFKPWIRLFLFISIVLFAIVGTLVCPKGGE